MLEALAASFPTDPLTDDVASRLSGLLGGIDQDDRETINIYEVSDYT